MFAFGQRDALSPAVANGNKCYGDKHHYPVLNGKIPGGGVFHGVTAKLYIWTNEKQYKADKQLRMG